MAMTTYGVIKLLSRRFLVFYISFLWKKGWIPIRSFMGGGKGKTISRYYVDQFIQSHRVNIHGDVLEIGRNVYRAFIPEENVHSFSCLDILDYPDVDIVADIQYMPQVQDERFDSIICTQVLEHIPNPFLAVKELHRVMKPGGKLFLTVPFLNNLHMEPHDYWRFTEYSLAELLKSFESVEINNCGTVYHHILATLGVHSEDISMDQNAGQIKTSFPVIISAFAKK